MNIQDDPTTLIQSPEDDPTKSAVKQPAVAPNPAPGAPSLPTLPVSTQPTTQPASQPIPSATPSAGQGGESGVAASPLTPAPLATPDPLAFAPAPAQSLTAPSAPSYNPTPTLPGGDASTQPVSSPIPSATPSAGQGGEQTAPASLPVASTPALPAGQSVDTDQSITDYINSLGGDWSPQEKASIQQHLTTDEGTPYTTDQYGVRTYTNNLGTIDTRNAGANNFSIDPTVASTPLDNTTAAQQQAVNDQATQTFLNNMTPAARAAYLANPTAGFSYGQGTGDSTAYSTGAGSSDPNNNANIQWEGDSGNGPSSTLQNGVQVDASGNPVLGGYNANDDALRQLTEQGAAPSTTPSTSPPATQPISATGNIPETNPTNPVTLPDSSLVSAGGNTTPTTIPTTTPPTSLPVQPSGDPAPGGALGSSLPPPVTATVPTPTTTSSTSNSTSTNPASSNGSLPSSTATSSPTPVSTSSTSTPYATLTPTTPDNSLANQTILPGSATDRMALANQEIQDWYDQDQPLFTRDERSATQQAASRGQLGGGALESSLGDVVNNHTAALRTAESQYLTEAQTGSIDDAYKNLGILQQQQQNQESQQQVSFGQNAQLQTLADSEQGQQWQQYMQALGFNATQVEQAFTNAFQVQQLSDSEDAQSFYQALQQEIQGNQNNPAQIDEYLAQLFAQAQPYAGSGV